MLCCNALQCLLQDSLFKSPFSLKSAGREGDKKILKYIKANLKLHLCYNEHMYLILQMCRAKALRTCILMKVRAGWAPGA